MLSRGQLYYLIDLVQADPLNEERDTHPVIRELQEMIEEKKVEQRLLRKLEQLALTHRQMLEVIEQEQGFLTT